MDELKILQKLYDMIEYGYQAIQQFPKSEKYALGKTQISEQFFLFNIKLLQGCFLVILLFRLNTAFEHYVHTSLYVCSHSLGFLPIKKYEIWCDKTVEIGKMLGGWLKTVNAGPKT